MVTSWQVLSVMFTLQIIRIYNWFSSGNRKCRGYFLGCSV